MAKGETEGRDGKRWAEESGKRSARARAGEEGGARRRDVGAGRLGGRGRRRALRGGGPGGRGDQPGTRSLHFSKPTMSTNRENKEGNTVIASSLHHTAQIDE